jgi:hypothetical protein
MHDWNFNDINQADFATRLTGYIEGNTERCNCLIAEIAGY